MIEGITIGVDLAKKVFQAHGVDAEGGVIFRRQLRRGRMLPFVKKQPPCLIGMEACATSHPWGREIEALRHQVRLMPPSYVKPYVKRNQNDMAEAEAICDAVRRPTSSALPSKNPLPTGSRPHMAVRISGPDYIRRNSRSAATVKSLQPRRCA